MRGDTAPSNPKTEGGKSARAEKSRQFFNYISQTNNSVWGLFMAFFTILGLKSGGGVKSRQNTFIRGRRLKILRNNDCIKMRIFSIF
jgi:hypothetical protein